MPMVYDKYSIPMVYIEKWKILSKEEIGKLIDSMPFEGTDEYWNDNMKISGIILLTRRSISGVRKCGNKGIYAGECSVCRCI